MQKNRTNQSLFILIGIVLAAIALVTIYIAYLWLGTSAQSNNDFGDLSASDGVTIIEPPQAIPDFMLTNHLGNAIQLSDLAGKFTLMTFGFTHCPDVCPTTIGDMGSVREKLGEIANNLNFVFLSVDGKRDTPEVLAEYFQTMRVDSFFIGMTGTETEIRAATDAFGVEFILHEPDSFGNYQVDHTAGIFLLDENSNWIRRYTFGTAINRIVEDLQGILEH